MNWVAKFLNYILNLRIKLRASFNGSYFVLWFNGQRGDLVQGNADIPVGTPIATFNFYGDPGTYGYGPLKSLGGKSGKSHTGIYLGQDEKQGVYILDQSAKFPPKVHWIDWDLWNGSPNEAGKRYYTIDYAKRHAK